MLPSALCSGHVQKSLTHAQSCLTSVDFQEVGELQEAKQLLIQQKLELQGQIEEAQKTLEQEQKEHQATRDGRQQREEQLLAHTREVQDQLVCLPVTLNNHRPVLPFSLVTPTAISLPRGPRRRPERSR